MLDELVTVNEIVGHRRGLYRFGSGRRPPQARKARDRAPEQAQHRVLAAWRRAAHASSRASTAPWWDVRPGMQVECIEGKDGKVSGVRLDGAVLPAEMVGRHRYRRVGRAALPPARRGTNGVSVDLQWPHRACRTCSASRTAPRTRTSTHPEMRSASSRSRTLTIKADRGKAIMRDAERRGEIRRHSVVLVEQFDLRPRRSASGTITTTSVVRGDPASKKFSVVSPEGRSCGRADCVNLTKDYARSRCSSRARRPPDREKLANPEVLLKDSSRTPSQASLLEPAFSLFF